VEQRLVCFDGQWAEAVHPTQVVHAVHGEIIAPQQPQRLERRALAQAGPTHERRGN